MSRCGRLGAGGLGCGLRLSPMAAGGTRRRCLRRARAASCYTDHSPRHHRTGYNNNNKSLPLLRPCCPGYVEMCNAAAGSGEDDHRPGAGAQVARPAARAAARRARRAPAAPRGAPCRLLHAAHGGRGRAAARPSRPPRVPARRAQRRWPRARGHRARCRGGRRPCRRGARDAACGVWRRVRHAGGSAVARRGA